MGMGREGGDCGKESNSNKEMNTDHLISSSA